MKHELVELVVASRFHGCVFEHWHTQNNFLYAKIIFGMNVKGQEP